jgi:hypothetical protein
VRLANWLYSWALEEFQRTMAWGPFRPRFVLLVFLALALLWAIAITLLRALGVA